MLSLELLEILRCPVTGQKVAPAPPEMIAELELRRTKAQLQNRAGAAVAEPITAGLVREDGAIFYPIRDGIPVMIFDEAIVVK